MSNRIPCGFLPTKIRMPGSQQVARLDAFAPVRQPRSRSHNRLLRRLRGDFRKAYRDCRLKTVSATSWTRGAPRYHRGLSRAARRKGQTGGSPPRITETKSRRSPRRLRNASSTTARSTASYPCTRSRFPRASLRSAPDRSCGDMLPLPVAAENRLEVEVLKGGKVYGKSTTLQKTLPGSRRRWRFSPGLAGRRRRRPPAGPAGRTQAASLAREGEQKLLLALWATDAGEAAVQDTHRAGRVWRSPARRHRFVARWAYAQSGCRPDDPRPSSITSSIICGAIRGLCTGMTNMIVLRYARFSA
jgi:hypothetical protein